jgi:hypothetical protein
MSSASGLERRMKARTLLLNPSQFYALIVSSYKRTLGRGKSPTTRRLKHTILGKHETQCPIPWPTHAYLESTGTQDLLGSYKQYS